MYMSLTGGQQFPPHTQSFFETLRSQLLLLLLLFYSPQFFSYATSSSLPERKKKKKHTVQTVPVYAVVNVINAAFLIYFTVCSEV